MGVRGYEATADGSEFDERWTEDIAKATGRITNVGLYPMIPAKYIVFPVGSTYYIRNGETGLIDNSDADESTAVQWALDNLTGGRDYYEKVLLKKDFTFSTTVEISDWTMLVLNGRVTRDVSASINLVENEDQVNGNDNIIIKGGVWDGAKTNEDNPGGSAFYFDASGGNCRLITIRDLEIENCRDVGIDFGAGFVQYGVQSGNAGVGIVRVYNVWISGTIRHGIACNTCSDSWFQNIGMDGSGVGLWMRWTGGTTFTDVYLRGDADDYNAAPYNAQMYLIGVENCEFENVIIDSSSVHGLRIVDEGQNLFSNLRVSRPVGTSNWDAILLDDTFRNHFTNVFIGQKGEGDDTAFDYAVGIHETGTSDDNQFSHVSANNCIAYYTLLGSDSRVRHSNPKTENRGIATILNGNNSIVVAHDLVGDPSTRGSVTVAGTHAEVESCYVDTVGAANFTIHKGGAGNVTANRDVYWYIEW